MELALHANATTTPKTRCYIQRSKRPVAELAAELGVSETTVAKYTTGLHDRSIPPISQETIQAIQQLSRDGHKGGAIAEELGVSQATVSRYRK